MLYVEVEVNGTAVKAFVDSGAQVTVMSPDCASRCGIMRLVDSRFQGMARGVGTAKILGRVHSAQIKIGTLHVPCAFTVMEGKHVDLLLGLDMLKRHQAVIDLKRNSLIIQDEEVPFLGESEIPKDLFNRSEEPTLIGPGGTNMGGIGQVSSPQMHNPQPQQAAAVSSTSRSQGRSTSAITATPSISHPETGIQQLEGLGFSRQQAISALDATNGDVDMAASLLFN
jgi:DNA damage-inducible protein 1